MGRTSGSSRSRSRRSAKNRLHFDLRAPGAIPDEVARLEALGATVLREEPIVVMADPEGNEFCVE